MTGTAKTIPWTDAQRVGIQDRSGSLVVSAAAGAGKTAVLTERCADLVAGRDAVDVDRLLVVTFTEAAAQEMRERIRRRLREVYEDRPSNRLARQLVLLDAASISTLHSFCLQVVRENFSTAGLEPDIGVLDDDEAQMLKDEVLVDLFEGLYAGQDDRSRQFARFVSNYGQGRDQGIRDQVRHLHDYLRSLPPPRRQIWKEQALAAYRLEADSTLTGEQFARLRGAIINEIDLMLEMSSVYLNAFRTHIGEHQGLQSGQAVHDFVTQLRDQIGKITTPAGWQAWIQKADTLPWERVNRWGDVPKFCRAWATWLKDNWKKRIGDRWLASAEAWAHGIAITAEAAELLIWLVNRFDELYSREKRRIGRIDYSDMEEHAFNLLVRPDGKASDIAAALQQRYEAVLVDEFQDINPIQAAIVLRVSRESADPPQPNLFVVGDVKQSIYGFRMTDPDLFRQRQQLVSRGRVAGKCVSLQENFRSRPEILTFVNSVFGKLMQEAESKIAYDDLAKLQPGRRDYPPLADPAVELHLLDGGTPSLRDEEPQTADEENDEDEVEAMAERQKEAYLIAGRIQELVGRPYRDGDQARSLRYRDMVILLRSTKTAARQYAEILRGCGVPVYAELRSGYFASREIKDMLCLLRVLENMQQDIPLAAVLRSPLFGEAFSDADLVDIRLARGDLPFHRAVRSYAQSGADMDLRRRLAGRMEMLDRWRAAARLQPLSEVIAGIYQETGLVEYATLLSDGPQCRANLMSLYERARQFGQFSRQGLRRFVNFIAEMIRSGRETTAPTAVSQAQDVVRIMSIHTSKGLEFPVVFLADLGRGFNDQDSIGPIVMDREGTLGVEARDPDRMVKCDTLIKLLAAGRVRRQNRSEELRVLYVAMTRAKERLILVGTPKRNTNEQLDEVRRLWGNWSGPLPRYTVRYARNPLDWILPAVAAKEAEGESGQPGRPPAAPATGGAAAVFVHPREVTDKWQVAQSARRPGSTQILAALDAEADKPPADAARTIARLAGTYRYDKLTRIPAITPVTELKGRLDWGDDDQEEGPRYASHSEQAAVPGSGFGVPRRLRPVGPGHAARQKGTATHLFLERVDLAGPTDRNTLRKQLADLVNRRLLSQVEADRIDLDGVSWFLNETDLGRQLRRSSNTVHRELPFIMRLEPQWLAPGSGSDDLEDATIVRGVIDVLWTTPEGIEIADFKTDAVEGAELRRRIELYKGQVRMYAMAIERIWKRPVGRLWLAFLHPRHIEPFAPAALKG